MEGRGTLFREIHKNTWLKRVTADNRKIPVGTKKPEKYWVVFCVHDDCEALLEGYTEPRQAASHSPDWTVSLQTTLHISHTLVPSENEYEFVIALAGETLRFNASSWEIMQEWVDTLRLKLREMKILSPKENLYSKMPEIRPPLLPTRDPTRDPLPATPPVPAAIVPGVERIVNTMQTSRNTALPVSGAASSSSNVYVAGNQLSEPVANNAEGNERNQNRRNTSPLRNPIENENDASSEDSFVVDVPNTSAPISSTSNTLSQNLIKMLYPHPSFSHQINDSVVLPNDLENDDPFIPDNIIPEIGSEPKSEEQTDENVNSLARTFAANVLFEPNTSSTSKRTAITNSTTSQLTVASQNDCELAEDTISEDSSVYGIYPTPEPIVIPRPQTTRGSATKQKKSDQNESQSNEALTDAGTTNITIIQVSSASLKDKSNAPNETAEKSDLSYMNNVQIIPSNYSQADQSAITTVQVTNETNTQNKIKEQISTAASANKSIISTSLESYDERQFGAVTNISIGTSEKKTFQPEQLHYEQVFITHTPSGASISTGNSEPNDTQPKINRIKVDSVQRSSDDSEIRPSTSTASTVTFTVAAATGITQDANIPNLASKSKDIPKNRHEENNHDSEVLSSRRPLLSRGLTEAAIVRPSRKDVNMLLNRINPQGNHCSPSEFHTNSQQRDSAEQRKRSSSTSDTQRNRNRSNNNNVPASGNAYVNSNSVNNNSEFRRTPAQPNQPFRNPNVDVSLRASGRLTLREQQVMQLRREMMHPGGVRIQLRRKDCTSSIAFVDAFGAAWISGWKQKQHPMLYNALHIGDQIISIASVTITNAKEANKVINNSTGQFIEFIIRRVPFGRVYAIRREIDRQCLGLIRDGNTATIVDVVPNSLSARHGLPPKAQSCDGLSLSFWVLTEINGRPLNLFFKENEVRDRLNAVGRDISILVQPSDLISKLKKQLKSMRNHKDYIVQ